MWWTGLLKKYLTFLPRKPTHLGTQLKTLCDARSQIILYMEHVEGESVDEHKQYNALYGKVIGLTLLSLRHGSDLARLQFLMLVLALWKLPRHCKNMVYIVLLMLYKFQMAFQMH